MKVATQSSAAFKRRLIRELKKRPKKELPAIALALIRKEPYSAEELENTPYTGR